jgi:hypothetical protein
MYVMVCGHIEPCHLYTFVRITTDIKRKSFNASVLVTCVIGYWIDSSHLVLRKDRLFVFYQGSHDV